MRLVNAHHITVASLHYATTPGDVALKQSGCDHAVFYQSACMVVQEGAMMNIWGGIPLQKLVT